MEEKEPHFWSKFTSDSFNNSNIVFLFIHLPLTPTLKIWDLRENISHHNVRHHHMKPHIHKSGPKRIWKTIHFPSFPHISRLNTPPTRRKRQTPQLNPTCFLSLIDQLFEVLHWTLKKKKKKQIKRIKNQPHKTKE